MYRYYYPLLILTVLFLLTGCVNLKVDKPLVDLGGDKDYRTPKQSEPAPGVPYEELTPQQRLQRDLAQCQGLLEIKEKKYEKLEEKCQEEKEHLRKELKKLEKQIENLQEENHDLRQKLRG